MKCPHCNKEHADTAKFCEETGNPLEPHFQYCKNDDCDFRSPLPLSAKFCPNCGNKLGGSSYVKFIARYVQTRDDNRCDLYSTDGDIIAEGLESIGISAFKNSDKYFFLKDNVLTALDPSYIHILDSFRGDGWNYSDLGQSSLYYIVSTSFGTGLMDRNFNSVIKVGKYDEIKHLWSWIIGVRNSNNWGILDLRKMSEPTLDYKKIQILHGYKEHYIVYRDYYDKYGLLSLDGTVLLHAQFDEIIDVVDEVERILIARNGDIGAINIDSKEVIIPFIFTEIDEISGTNGFAYQVSRTVQSGIYSVEGEELLPLTEDDLFTYCIDSKIKVEITDNNGECTEKRFLIPASFCEYDQNGLIIFDENDNGRRGYRRRRLIDKRGTIIFSDYCMDLYNQGNYYIVDYNDQPSKIINYNGKRVGIIPVGFHGARYCNGNIISFADRSNKTCIFNSDGELLYQIPDNVIVAESFNNDRLYYFDNISSEIGYYDRDMRKFSLFKIPSYNIIKIGIIAVDCATIIMLLQNSDNKIAAYDLFSSRLIMDYGSWDYCLSGVHRCSNEVSSMFLETVKNTNDNYTRKLFGIIDGCGKTIIPNKYGLIYVL